MEKEVVAQCAHFKSPYKANLNAIPIFRNVDQVLEEMNVFPNDLSYNWDNDKILVKYITQLISPNKQVQWYFGVYMG